MSPEQEELHSVILTYLSREKYHGLSDLIHANTQDALAYELSEIILDSGFKYGVLENELEAEYERGYEVGETDGYENGSADTEFRLNQTIEDLEQRIKDLIK